MTISKELLDELLSGVERPEDLLGDKGLMKELKVRLMERMLGAELTEHLGYEPHGEPASQQSNRRNGAARKVLKGNDGAVPIDIPRDRDGSFEPELIQKGQTRIDGMTGRIPRNTHLMILKPNGATNILQSPQAGGEHGRRSSRSLPSRQRCARSSTPPTPRKPEPGDPENHQNPWQLSNRCRRHQADLSGHPQFRKGGSLRQRMGCRPKPVRYSLPRTVQQMTRFNCMG